MSLLNDLLSELPDGEVIRVCIGLHWTAVEVQIAGQLCCGLASTLTNPHEHDGEPQVPKAGKLTEMSGRELAELSFERARPTLASVGVATMNALLPPPKPETYSKENAEYTIAKYGVGKTVAIVGRFPFVPRLESQVGELFVLSLNPREGDHPAEAAPEILPQAEIVAITGMALINHTMESLFSLCSPEALIMVLGPSTPFSEVMFDYGVDFLSGSLVTDVQAVMQAVSQAANFRQVHQAGVQLVTVERPGLEGLKR